jgi:hypothetical protein
MSDALLAELIERVRHLERRIPRKRVLNQKEAATYLSMSVSKLQALHKEGIGPKRSTSGRIHQYQIEHLDEYLDNPAA